MEYLVVLEYLSCSGRALATHRAYVDTPGELLYQLPDGPGIPVRCLAIVDVAWARQILKL